MTRNHSLVDNVAYITSYIECINSVNKIHHILDFGNDIMCPNGIDTYQGNKILTEIRTRESE